MIAQVANASETMENSQISESMCWVVCVCHFLVMILMLRLLINGIEGYMDAEDSKVRRSQLGLSNEDDGMYMFYIIYHGFWFILYLSTFIYAVLNFNSMANMNYICCVCILILFVMVMGITQETDIDGKYLELLWFMLLCILSCCYLYDYCVILYAYLF